MGQERINLFKDDPDAKTALYGHANRMFAAAAVGANIIRKLSPSTIDQQTWVSVLFEFTNFYVAMTASQAERSRKVDRREEVGKRYLDVLIPGIVNYIFDAATQDMAAVRSVYMEDAIARFSEYRACEKMIPSYRDDRRTKTGLSLLCRRIGQLAGKESEVTVEMTCRSHVMDTLAVIEFDEAAAVCT